MTAQHSPGHWEAEAAVDYAGFETGKLWIIIQGEPRAYDFDHAADAQLASAAPELLEALDLFRSFGCPACCGDCAGANPPMSSCPMQIANTAIAKARGEA